MAVKMFITPFVSMSSEMRFLGMWKCTSFLLMACFQWNKQPTATLDGNSVFIVDSIACSKTDVQVVACIFPSLAEIQAWRAYR
jgi:hypothetical protein